MRGRYVNKLQRKMFRSAFVTAAFTEFTQIIALTIDSILVCSYLGELEIAAVGLSGPFLFLVGIPASALSSGLQTVCTQEMGRGHIEGVSRRFSETLILTSIFLTAATALVLLTVPQLAGILGAGAEVPELLEPTSQYLYGLSIEIIPFILYSVLIPVVILDNDSSLVMISSLVGCAANISFDLLAIVNHWGLFGIGLGSSMSVLISFGVLLIHFLRKDRVIRFHFVRIKGTEVLEVLHLGLPKAVHAVASMIRSLVMNALVLSVGGSIAMSVLTIHGTVMDFVDIIAVGIAGAVGVLSGIAYGELNGEEAEGSLILSIRYILVSSALLIAVLTAFPRAIAGLFLVRESSGFELLLFALTCIAVSIIPNALIYVRVSWLQARGKTKDAQMVEAGANMVFLVVFAWGFSRLFGIRGVFAAFPASKLFSLILVDLVHVKRTRKPFPALRDFLGLDERFFPTARDVIAYPIKTLDECLLASEQTGMFCRGHGFDPTTSNMSALCVEEITTNIITYGGKSKGKDITAEIRIMAVDNMLILRVRDNGMAFNMNSLAKMLSDTENPMDKLGLRLICAAAKDINYYRVYGMNTTVIRFYPFA